MSDFHQAVFFDQVPDSLKAAKYISTDIYPIIKMKVGAWREEARLSDVCVSVQVPTASRLHHGLNKLFKKGDVWALFGTSDRFLKLNGNFFAPHVESLLRLLPADVACKTFVNPNMTKEEHGEADRTWVWLMFLAKKISRIATILSPSLRTLKNDLISMGASETEGKSLVHTVAAVHWGGVLLSTLILRKPKFALVICFYNTAGLIFINAMKRKQVPAYDVQHGIMSASHFAYRPFTSYPSGGYNTLPTGFLCWNEEQAECIRTQLAGSPKVESIGYPLKLLLSDHPEIFKDVKLPFNGTSQAILVTVDERNGPSFVRDLIQKNPDQKWMIRLHPTQKHLLSYWESQLKDLGEIDVRLSTLAPLELLWSQVQTHLSAYSSVAIEAAMNGVKTYFWSPLAKEMYPSLFSQNYAHQFDGQISANAEKNNFKMIVTNDWRTWCKQHLVRNI